MSAYCEPCEEAGHAMVAVGVSVDGPDDPTPVCAAHAVDRAEVLCFTSHHRAALCPLEAHRD